jgi:hypothetical protein
MSTKKPYITIEDVTNSESFEVFIRGCERYPTHKQRKLIKIDQKEWTQEHLSLQEIIEVYPSI